MFERLIAWAVKEQVYNSKVLCENLAFTNFLIQQLMELKKIYFGQEYSKPRYSS
jgi:hypothetical protein